MHLDSDDLLAAIRADYPDVYEISQLRLMNARLLTRVTELEADLARRDNIPTGPRTFTGQYPALGEEAGRA